MLIGSIILLVIAFVVFIVIFDGGYQSWAGWMSLITFILGVILIVFGCLNGFINYPKTEGTHQGVITAVDLEGIWFRRHEVYLKSSGYTAQSDETKYCIYEYETDLRDQLKNAIGKEVKLNYGHDGGYINWKSCGTYHIKSIEILEEGKKNAK